jgi:hypothetical protein
MKAISVRAPWWWAILHAGKDIENRDWHTNFRGRVLIHASKWWNWEEVREDLESIQLIRKTAALPEIDKVVTGRMLKDAGGCVVGSVEIVDYVSHSTSPWFFGKYGFVLRDPRLFDVPWAVKGALGFFEVEEMAHV